MLEIIRRLFKPVPKVSCPVTEKCQKAFGSDMSLWTQKQQDYHDLVVLKENFGVNVLNLV